MIRASVSDLLGMMVQSLRTPRVVLHQVLGWQMQTAHLVQIALLLSVIALMLQILVEAVFPDGPMQNMTAMFGGPLGSFALQFGMMMATAIVMAIVGRAFGGRGQFIDCLKAVVWLNFILLAVQFVQLVAVFLYPPLALLIFVFSVFLSLALTVAYVMEVHRFENVAMATFGTLATMVAALLIVSVVLTIFGFSPQLEAVSDV